MSGPKWPTTIWYPQMLKMLTRKPVLLPRGKHTTSLLHTEAAHPLHNKLQFPAGVLPADHSKQDEFRVRLSQVIRESWRPSTRQQYASHRTRWSKFCVQFQCDPLRPPVDMVLQFLTTLYVEGLGCSAINTARSALSAVVILPDNKTVGCHRLVI